MDEPSELDQEFAKQNFFYILRSYLRLAQSISDVKLTDSANAYLARRAYGHFKERKLSLETAFSELSVAHKNVIAVIKNLSDYANENQLSYGKRLSKDTVVSFIRNRGDECIYPFCSNNPDANPPQDNGNSSAAAG